MPASDRPKPGRHHGTPIQSFPHVDPPFNEFVTGCPHDRKNGCRNISDPSEEKEGHIAPESVYIRHPQSDQAVIKRSAGSMHEGIGHPFIYKSGIAQRTHVRDRHITAGGQRIQQIHGSLAVGGIIVWKFEQMVIVLAGSPAAIKSLATGLKGIAHRYQTDAVVHHDLK